MRIAIPLHSFEPGGVERVALRLAEQWQAAGHEPIIVLGRSRGKAAATAPALDYRALPEPLPTDRWETLWMIWTLFQFLLGNRVDAIFCAGNTYTVVCVIVRLLIGDRCPPVLVKISNDLDRPDMGPLARPFYRWWLRIQRNCLDGFVAIAEPMRGQLARKLGLPERAIRTIPDPALSERELDRLATDRHRRDPAEPVRFLTVGRLVPQKNQALLLEAFARHARPKDTLEIAGDGPERARLEAQARTLGIAARVHFAGHVDDVAPLFMRADVFVLSSRYEGAPAAVIEALAAGLPIAATDCCASMGWLTGDGRFGVICQPDDSEALGVAMNTARALEPDRATMRKLAATFTLERSARVYLRAFAELAQAWRANREENLQHSVRTWRVGGV